MTWLTKMYMATAIGSTAALFYPTLISLFKSVRPPVALQAISPLLRYAIYVVVGILIGVVVAALTFATFLGDKANQDLLKAAGSVAYFSAFSAGFAAGSLFEEPLK